jgi:hypothetical protein
MMSKTDPDAALVRRGTGQSRPRYHHHRVVDDHKGVITALETTPGSIAENKKLIELIDQHEANTRQKVEIAVADHKYGTSENYVRAKIEGSLPIWVMPPSDRTTITLGRSFPRAHLLMMPRVTLIAARPGKHCGRADCILSGARSNTWRAKESAALARCGASAPVPGLGGRSSDTNISTFWIGHVCKRIA